MSTKLKQNDSALMVRSGNGNLFKYVLFWTDEELHETDFEFVFARDLIHLKELIRNNVTKYPKYIGSSYRCDIWCPLRCYHTRFWSVYRVDVHTVRISIRDPKDDVNPKCVVVDGELPF